MLQYVPFLLFGVAFLGLIAWLVLKKRSANAALARKLELMGFAPCPAESDRLVEKITRLENNAEYRYRVENPMKGSAGGNPVYFYRKCRHRQGHVVTADEFLFPRQRPSKEGLLLFVKPTGLPAGTATHLIGAVATGAWDSQPDDLTRLEIPVDLKKSNLIGALGPRNRSLYDLIDTEGLSLIQQVGDGGAMIVTCRGEWCSLSSPQARLPFDIDRLWPIVRQLAGAICETPVGVGT